MQFKYIDPKSFELILKNCQRKKKKKKWDDIIRGRFDMESIKESKKPAFVINLITSFKPILVIAYRIFFWEKNEVIDSFLKSEFKQKEYKIVTPYKNGMKPGIIYLEEEVVDESFLNILLKNHFNFELAKSPSLNIRPQICINRDNFMVLLDIYDDRGFNIYYYLRPDLFPLQNMKL